MNRFTSCAVTVVLVAMVSGCGAAAKTIMSSGERKDVFKEVPLSDPVPPGHADVIIKADIKTHVEGYYVAESGASSHGKPTYPFLVTIDGQDALWNAAGFPESKPAYDADGRTSRDPEAREGMKYVLEKKVRVPAGSHTLVFGLPEDDYFIGTRIAVQSGETAVLEYKPVYRYKTVPARIPTFMKGIAHYDVYVNGSKSTP